MWTSIARAVLMALAGWLSKRGILTDDQVGPAVEDVINYGIPIVITLATIGWSWVEKKRKEEDGELGFK